MVKSEKIAGIQLAMFELIWPAFPWIKQIFLNDTHEKWAICIQADMQPDANEIEDCYRLIKEIVDIAEQRREFDLSVKTSGTSCNGIELISDEIFKRIAAEIAPWRLDAGR